MNDKKLLPVFSNYQYFQNFKSLLFKFFKIQNVKIEYNSQLKILIDNYKDDKSFYIQIKNLDNTTVKETDEYNDHEKFSYVARNYSKILKPFIKSHFIYLDIGCGTGYKAFKLGNDLNLNPECVYGVDIPYWSLLDEEHRRNMRINFQFMENETLLFEDNKFDFISLFMVLHHVKNLDKLTSEINRIMKKGGILIIREHDAGTEIQKNITDAEHYLYDYIKIKNYNHLEDKEFYTNYNSCNQWKNTIESKGFVMLSYNFDKNKRNEISPTRAFHMIFKLI